MRKPLAISQTFSYLCSEIMPYLPLTYRHAATPCPTFGGRTGEAFMGIAEAFMGTVEAVLPGGRSEAKNTPPSPTIY